MRLIIKSKKIDLTQKIKSSIPKKFLKFEKWIPEQTLVELMVSEERGHRGGEIVVASLNVDLPHYKIIHLEESADNVLEAIDGLENRLEAKLRKFRERRLGQRRQDKLLRTLSQALVYFPKKITGKSTRIKGPRIIKRKCFSIKPIGEKEAIEQMKLLGHDFFVFKNRKNDKFSVVYRRRDKNFGLIECD
jgi:putative sigma-54 modulation protein